MKEKNVISAAIDIGTTTISAVVLDITGRCQIESFNLANDSTIIHNESAHEQDPARILEIASELADMMFEKYPNISCLGFTGQMHGILYVNSDGIAVSPLFTWQDGRGNLVSDTGKSYCNDITDLTGRAVSTGFGLVTHYCNVKNGKYIDTSLKICSIMDYLAMRFTGNCEPIVHPSVAASFGLFDLSKRDFDREAFGKLDVCEDVLPKLALDDKPIGRYRGVPVSAAIGDNQASVFGSVRDEADSVLVNYGTGSQISLITEKTDAKAPLEVRPYLFGKNLICGCALCGGSAYAILEGFFRSYASACGLENLSQYKVMDLLAEKAYDEGKEPLDVSTLFKGTRQNPAERGGIYGVGEENFTPDRLILGTICGMVNELHGMYLEANEEKRVLVASGNAVQKGRVLRAVLCDKFATKPNLPLNKEEAATGAAMYASLCADLSLTLEEVKDCIEYA